MGKKGGGGKISSEVLFWLVYAATESSKKFVKKKNSVYFFTYSHILPCEHDYGLSLLVPQSKFHGAAFRNLDRSGPTFKNLDNLGFLKKEYQIHFQ